MDANEEKYLEILMKQFEVERADINNRVSSRMNFIIQAYTITGTLGSVIFGAVQVFGVEAGLAAVLLPAIFVVFWNGWRTDHNKIRETQKWLLQVEEIFEVYRPAWVTNFQLHEHFNRDQPPTHTRRNQLAFWWVGLIGTLCFAAYMVVNAL